MERLTKRNSEGIPVLKISDKCDECGKPIYRLNDLGNGEPIKKLAEYEDLEEQCIEENICSLKMLLKKWNEFFDDIAELYEYRDLEKQGLMLKLPCKVGDYLYEPRPDRGMVTEYIVESITIFENSVHIDWKVISGIYSSLYGTPAEKIGKTVFFTKAEAEEALKRMGEKNERSTD